MVVYQSKDPGLSSGLSIPKGKTKGQVTHDGSLQALQGLRFPLEQYQLHFVPQV